MKVLFYYKITDGQYKEKKGKVIECKTTDYLYEFDRFVENEKSKALEYLKKFKNHFYSNIIYNGKFRLIWFLPEE